MKTRIAAVAAAAVLAGSSALVTVTAHADPVTPGAYCAEADAGKTGTTRAGTQMRCTSEGNDRYRWRATGQTAPVTQVPPRTQAPTQRATQAPAKRSTPTATKQATQRTTQAPAKRTTQAPTKQTQAPAKKATQRGLASTGV